MSHKMKNSPSACKNQQGFAIGIILLALVLGLVVIGAISSGLGDAVGFTSSNKRQLQATSVINQAEALGSTVEMVTSLGYTTSQILLEVTDATCPGTNFCLYNTTNGIDELFPSRNVTTTATVWVLDPDLTIRSNAAPPTHVGTNLPDSAVRLQNITANICRYLNNLTTGIPLDADFPAATFSNIDATHILTVTLPSELSSVPQQLCVYDSGLDNYMFYSTVEAN